MKNTGGFFVILIIAIGLMALFGMIGGAGNPNPQSAYVPNNGDCVVLPQGQDPVYDQFYAQQVNPYNCEAFKDQGQAHLYDAFADQVTSETQSGKLMLYGFLVILVMVFGFFGWAISQGGKKG